MYWVQGHSRLTGNENADEYARHGSSISDIGPESAMGISKSQQAKPGHFNNLKNIGKLCPGINTLKS